LNLKTGRHLSCGILNLDPKGEFHVSTALTERRGTTWGWGHHPLSQANRHARVCAGCPWLRKQRWDLMDFWGNPTPSGFPGHFDSINNTHVCGRARWEERRGFCYFLAMWHWIYFQPLCASFSSSIKWRPQWYLWQRAVELLLVRCLEKTLASQWMWTLLLL
jgi:hypothetical protein